MRQVKRESGLMIIDAVVAMTILGVLLGVLAVAISQQRKAARELQTQRKLERLAEGVLTDLQLGASPRITAWETEVQPTSSIDRLPDPGPSDGWAWIEVTAEHERRRATVTGPAPVASLDLYGDMP